MFVDHYNHQRYDESLKVRTQADVYFGRGQSILAKREKIERETIAKRRLHSQRHAAWYEMMSKTLARPERSSVLFV